MHRSNLLPLVVSVRWQTRVSRAHPRVPTFDTASCPSYPQRHQTVTKMAPEIKKTLAVLAVAGVGVMAYAIYFDHKRRTDTQFRKRLRTSSLTLSAHPFDDLVRQGKEKA